MASLEYIIFGLCFVFLIYIIRKNRRTLRLPPGPIGVPLLGYLPWLDPVNPHITLTNLSKKYGRIYGLRMGSLYTVLLSDPRLVRQAFAKDAFAGRAPLYLTQGLLENKGLIFTDGDLWKDQRRFVVGCLKNLGMVKFGSKRDKMEERILTVVNECTSKLKIRATKDGIDPLDLMQHCMGNMINDIVFGKIYDEDDEMWKWMRHMQEEGVKHIGIAGTLNFFPFLRFLPRYNKTITLLLEGKRKSHEVYQNIIDEHRTRREKTDSLLAAFDEEMQNRINAGDPGHFTQAQFYHLLADVFGAGVDTTLTTLRWFLLFMVAYPHEQKKVQDEMSELLGEKEPTLEDRSVLIRLEAAISEAQRLRAIVPLGVPHGTTEDTELGGYDIPKGSMIIALQWAIHMDPSYWNEPLRFKPERFISEDGKLAKPEAFIPFQIGESEKVEGSYESNIVYAVALRSIFKGKRMCVGDELARMLLFLFAARILRSFVISAPPGTNIDLDGECGITLFPKRHRLVFTSRE